MSISIIIPVYNEEECIQRCIEETERAFEDIDYEIIAVNDGSTDASPEIISSSRAGNHRIKLVSYPGNKGYSHAIRQGIQLASKEYTSYLDADLQYLPSELRKMYNFALQYNEIFVLGEPARKYYGAYRRFLSFAYNLLVSVLLDIHVADANSLKIIKTQTLKQLDLRREFAAIELEILVGLANRSDPIKSFRISVEERFAGKSKSSPKLIFTTLQDIIALRRSRDHLTEIDRCTG